MAVSLPPSAQERLPVQHNAPTSSLDLPLISAAILLKGHQPQHLWFTVTGELTVLYVHCVPPKPNLLIHTYTNLKVLLARTHRNTLDCKEVFLFKKLKVIQRCFHRSLSGVICKLISRLTFLFQSNSSCSLSAWDGCNFPNRGGLSPGRPRSRDLLNFATESTSTQTICLLKESASDLSRNNVS